VTVPLLLALLLLMLNPWESRLIVDVRAGVAVAVVVPLRVPLILPSLVLLALFSTGDGDGDGDSDSVCVSVGTGVSVTIAVAVIVVVRVRVGIGVSVATIVALEVEDCVRVGIGDAVAVVVAYVAVGVGLSVRVGTGKPVTVVASVCVVLQLMLPKLLLDAISSAVLMLGVIDWFQMGDVVSLPVLFMLATLVKLEAKARVVDTVGDKVGVSVGVGLCVNDVVMVGGRKALVGNGVGVADEVLLDVDVAVGVDVNDDVAEDVATSVGDGDDVSVETYIAGHGAEQSANAQNRLQLHMPSAYSPSLQCPCPVQMFSTPPGQTDAQPCPHMPGGHLEMQRFPDVWHTLPHASSLQKHRPSKHVPFPEHGMPLSSSGHRTRQVIPWYKRLQPSHVSPPQNPVSVLLKQMQLISSSHSPWPLQMRPVEIPGHCREQSAVPHPTSHSHSPVALLPSSQIPCPVQGFVRPPGQMLMQESPQRRGWQSSHDIPCQYPKMSSEGQMQSPGPKAPSLQEKPLQT